MDKTPLVKYVLQAMETDGSDRDPVINKTAKSSPREDLSTSVQLSSCPPHLYNFISSAGRTQTSLFIGPTEQVAAGDDS